MVFNIVAGFVLPWIIGAFLFRRDPGSVILGAPLASLAAFVVNQLGCFLGYFKLHPLFPRTEALASTPVDLGLYGVLGGFFVYFLKQTTISKALIWAAFTVATTVMEMIGFWLGRITYGNGWGLGWTAVSYSAAYAFGLGYYALLERYEIVKGPKTQT